MDTLTITLVASVIAYLIGRYFKAVKLSEFDRVSIDCEYFESLYKVEKEYAIQLKELFNESMELSNNRNKRLLELQSQVVELNTIKEANEALKTQNSELLHQISNLATVKIVANKDKHPAANDNYLYIEGEINGKREAGLLRLKQWEQAKETLLKNPEDKPL